MPTAASSTRSSVGAMPTTANGSSWSGPGLLRCRRVALPADYEEKIVTVIEWGLHSAPCFLHRAVAAHRPSPARAPLRRPARLFPWLDANDDAQAGAAGLGPQGRSRRRLPARDPRAAQEADGVAQSGLPRSAVPASGLSQSLRGVARRSGRQAGVPGRGRVAGAGTRSGLRGRAGAGHRRGTRCRTITRPGVAA